MSSQNFLKLITGGLKKNFKSIDNKHFVFFIYFYISLSQLSDVILPEFIISIKVLCELYFLILTLITDLLNNYVFSITASAILINFFN